MTGIVVPFPTALARPAAPEARLARALNQLATAVAEQRAAVKLWRGALHDLKMANDRLGESLSRYAGELSRLGTSVGKLDDEISRSQGKRGSV